MIPYETKNKPQINADERRFNASDMDLSAVIGGQSTKRKSIC